MKRRIVLMGMVMVLVLISVRNTSAQAAATDANLSAASDATTADVEEALDQASNAALAAESDIEPQFRGEICGTAIIPGPRTSSAITFTVRNQVNDLIDFVILDPFSALGRRSLPIQSVFGITPPAGGAVTDRYPDGANDGKGPVVLQTTSFNNGDTLSFSTTLTPMTTRVSARRSFR